ncbi:hypothetical protein ASC90_25730 [Rhizobium sp. Root1220]|nr:hypothetical protein ASC90_25730 [Rhizobium sp. Root1220]
MVTTDLVAEFVRAANRLPKLPPRKAGVLERGLTASGALRCLLADRQDRVRTFGDRRIGGDAVIDINLGKRSEVRDRQMPTRRASASFRRRPV